MASDALLAHQLGVEPSEKAVNGGSFVVSQTHLGFCPPDVKLEIRDTGLVLLDDEHEVCVYPYTDLVMWSQSRADVTIMLLKNLRRVIFTARSRWHAKKIVMKLHEVTDELAKAEGVGKRKSSIEEQDDTSFQTTSFDQSHRGMTVSTMLESHDETREAGAKMFRVQQTHLTDAPDIIMLIVDENGLGLLNRDTGKMYTRITWFQLLLWRADAGAVVLILTHTNQQIELLTANAQAIAQAMTAHALALREALSEKVVVQETNEAPHLSAGLEFRRELIQFEPTVGRGARSSDTQQARKQPGCAGWLRYLFGDTDDVGPIHAREQLHAIFSSVDKDASGTLGLDELAELLRSLNIYNEQTKRELSMNELQLLMIEMDAYDNEVTFDGFAAWAMGESAGSINHAGGSRLKQGVEHRQKEAAAVSEIFDKLDTDKDGLLDRTDFRNLMSQTGVDISETAFYRAWATLDVNRVGQISFKDFFSWYKSDSADKCVSGMVRAMRRTRLLVAAKGAMVFSVDKRNQKAHKNLRAMFDALDSHGTADVGLLELLTMVDDLHVKMPDKDVHAALTEMNSTGVEGGNITFDDLEVWWCEPPNDTKSGVLRSQLKYAAFRAKAAGAILSVDSSNEGAETAEKYINDALAAAYKPVLPLHGKSLGIFGSHSSIRKWCQSVIFEHPYADDFFIVVVVINLILLAMQDTASDDARTFLPRFNFLVMLIFTIEAGMRIIVKQLRYGKGAYLEKWSWDVFDFVILGVIWAVYFMPPEIASGLGLNANMYITVGDDTDLIALREGPDWLSMVRSLRVLRFFLSIRNIISAVLQGRVLMASIIFLFFYLSVIFFVLGYQMYHGVTSTFCSNVLASDHSVQNVSSIPWTDVIDNGTSIVNVPQLGCMWDDMDPMCNTSFKIPCPKTINCSDSCYPMVPNSGSIDRLEHTDRYGFDTYTMSLYTLMALITCDDWEKFTRMYDQPDVLSKDLAWPFFFIFVVVTALFFVNLFVSGLAYSFIQIRAASRAQRAQDRLKKVMVDAALQEGENDVTETFKKHALQICMPRLTRKAKDIMNDQRFANVMRYVIVMNLALMTADSWDLAKAKKDPENMSPGHHFQDVVLSVGEVFFTMAYTYEIMVKLQAVGFKVYFKAEDTGQLMSNVVDFVIVLTAWPETLMVLAEFFDVEILGTQHTEGIESSLSNFKILRAFRVMKLLLIVPAVRSLILKAFKGMDTILSLILLIIFVLTMAAITGMNFFKDCHFHPILEDVVVPVEGLRHEPTFANFEQALMVAFQVMTADDWSPLMFKYMDCMNDKGEHYWGVYSTAVSACYFITLVTVCYFILSNLFIAIFIENFKLEDEVKRDMQVEQHIQGLTKGGSDDKDGSKWVTGLRDGFQGIEDMMGETSTVNVLKRRTTTEFMRGARMTGRITKKGLKKGHRLARGDEETRKQSKCNTTLAIWCGCFEKYRPKEKYEGLNQSDRVKAWKMKALGQTGTLSVANGAWKKRPWHQTLQAKEEFTTAIYVAILVSTAVTVLVTKEEPEADPLSLLLILFFGLEYLSKTIAYGFLGGPDYEVWPNKPNIYELVLLVTQVLAIFPEHPDLPIGSICLALQPFRVVRLMYMFEGFRVQVEGLSAAIAAVWTALFLLFTSFVFFGIIGMELFKGRMHTCAHDRTLSEVACVDIDLCKSCFDAFAANSTDYALRGECEAMQTPFATFASKSECEDEWAPATFNFDDIIQALKTLMSVWSLAGWTSMWYDLIDAPDNAGEAPVKDNSVGQSFIYFFGFILINSFLLTKLVTSMLCDFFAQKSGSDKTTDQRNWNFMSIFLIDALKLEVIKPPEKHKKMANWSYRTIHNRWFKGFIEVAIVLSVVSTFGQQQFGCTDKRKGTTGACTALITLDIVVLVAYWMELILTLWGVGWKKYFENYRLVGLVVIVMTLDSCWRFSVSALEMDSVRLSIMLAAANCVRALRVVSVLKRIHPIKKIIFLVSVAADKVLTLFGLMSAVFVIFAFYAHTLCKGTLDEGCPDCAINTNDNFDDTKTALGVLWQICTGQSMMGANKECAEWYRDPEHDAKYPVLGPAAIYFFFDAFFFVANILFLNLFIALLLDFDLMGSEDMAVSDQDLLLFKRFWCDNETGKGDISSGLLAERRDIHSVIHLRELKDFVLGMSDMNVGTFSMMPRVDRYYFNRVLYELKKNQQDVVDSKSGTKVHTIPFFDVLYALCHIRFSSSCLSLAEEVERSLDMVDYIEGHAAKIIQVAGRAFCARRSVNMKGSHAPPGSVWPIESEMVDNNYYHIAHAEPGVKRCFTCTLPKEAEYQWCACIDNNFSMKKSGLMSESADERGRRPPIEKALYKSKWDISVNCAQLLTMDALIKTERLTPEHVVAEEYDRQAAALKKKQSSWMGLIQSEGVHANQGCLARFMTRGMRKREEKIENLQLRGLHLMSEGKWAAAAKHFREALDLDPENLEDILVWKETCDRKERTRAAKKDKEKIQKQNRKAMLKTQDSITNRSVDPSGKATKVHDADLDEAPLTAAVRAVFSLPSSVVITNFSHMHTKEDKRLVAASKFMQGVVELAKQTRSTLTRNQIEVLMRTIDQMPCSDYPDGDIHYRDFASMVCTLDSLVEFCDAVVDEGAAMKLQKRRERKGKLNKNASSLDASQMQNSMFQSTMVMGSLDKLMSRDGSIDGSSNDELQENSDEEEAAIDTSRFYCPITKELMVDPVKATDGHSYERAAYIDLWDDHGQTIQSLEKRMSPVTGDVLESDETRPHHKLRKEIAAWKATEEQRAAKKKDKAASIKERTKKLRQESTDMSSFDAQNTTTGSGPRTSFAVLDGSSVLGLPGSGLSIGNEPPARSMGGSMFEGFAMEVSTDEGTAEGKKKRLGRRSKKKDAEKATADLKKFSNPLSDPMDGKKSHANPLESFESEVEVSFESEFDGLGVGGKRKQKKLGDMRTSMSLSRDGKTSNPMHMSLSLDGSSADEEMFDKEDRERAEAIAKAKQDKKDSKKEAKQKKKAKAKAGGKSKLGKINPLNLVTSTAPEIIAQYKALHNVTCHVGANPTSEANLAGVFAGDYISVTERVRMGGTIRVKCEKGWASVTNTDNGELNLDVVENSSYKYMTLSAVNLRQNPEHSAKKVTYLLKETETVTQQHTEIITEIENGQVRVDIWIQCADSKGNMGWAAVKDESDQLQMEFVDKFDELRYQLRKLDFESLKRQAVNIAADPGQLTKATDFSRCIDPRNALVEIIKQLYEEVVPVLDLKELPPGWDGSETGRLGEGERVAVDMFGGTLGHDVHDESIGADLRALHEKRGYVMYELPHRGLHGSYEVKIDKIRRTVVLPRENLIKQNDELANMGLFMAVLGNNVENLQKLLERTEKPSDALDRRKLLIPQKQDPTTEDKSDMWRAEPGVLRVVESINHNDTDFDREHFDKTLYEVSCARAAEQYEPLPVKQLLMEKLLLKAVVTDDLTSTIQLMEEDGEVYVLPLLRALCSASGPWSSNPQTPVLELARRIWSDGGYGHHGGSANTLDAAVHLGGQCWLYLSKKWVEEFGEEFNPNVHTAEVMQQMHGAVSKKQMKKRFGAKKDAAATEEQTGQMLDWKARQFDRSPRASERR